MGLVTMINAKQHLLIINRVKSRVKSRNVLFECFFLTLNVKQRE